MEMSNYVLGLQSEKFFSDPLLWVKEQETRGVLVFLLCIFGCLLYQMRKNHKTNFPPGPTGLPIVGVLPFMKRNMYLQLNNTAKKYGDVFSLQLGSQSVVVLNSAEVIKEVMSRAEFQGRSPNSIFNTLGRESPFFASENHIWNEHRKFVVQSMKDLGLGKSKLEELVQQEIDILIEFLKKTVGKPVDLTMPITKSVSNNICLLVSNERYDYDDPEREKLFNNMHRLSRVLGQTASQAFFPWLRNVPFINWYMSIEDGRRAAQATKNLFLQKIRQHEATLDSSNVRDIIDMYLLEMKHKKENNLENTLSVDRLVGGVADLFGAGTMTVKVALLWCVYIMAAFPDVQKRVQKEIENRFGSGQKPEFRDSKLMPYTNAVLLEIMRWKTIVPIPFFRYTTKDSTVRGYNIPKGSTVMANLYNAHYDSKIWSEPNTFLPERFLSKDGQTVVKSTYFIPYSVGKRACPGENLANIEVFLYFVSLLQAFNIQFPKDYSPTFEAKFVVTYMLDPYKVILTPRS